MEAERGATLAHMAHTRVKTIAEGDAEVSEAVDFARYAAVHPIAIEQRQRRGRRSQPLGVVVVASPWNFPYAIPAGGVLRGAGRGQCGDPEAGAGGASTAAASSSSCGGRACRATCCSSSPAPTTRSGDGW